MCDFFRNALDRKLAVDRMDIKSRRIARLPKTGGGEPVASWRVPILCDARYERRTSLIRKPLKEHFFITRNLSEGFYNKKTTRHRLRRFLG